MNRIDTASISAHAFSGIATARERLDELTRAASSQARADDVKGFGNEARTLVSGRALIARTVAGIEKAQIVASRASMQDLALDRASDAIAGLKTAALEALALDSGEGIGAALEQTLQGLAAGLNLRREGRYLFGGNAVGLPPVATTGMNALVAGDVGDAVGPATSASRVVLDEENVTIAPLGTALAEPALEILHRLGRLDAGADGPFARPLNADQRRAIESELAAIDRAHEAIIEAQADNGRLARRAEDAEVRLGLQRDMLEREVGDRVGIDPAEIATRLSEAQLAYQVSASVFNTLRGLTLLDVL